MNVKELIKTNNLVTLSFVEALLKEAEIPYQSLDHNMSTLYGSMINQLSRRILVDDDDEIRARRLLFDAGLEAETEPPEGI